MRPAAAIATPAAATPAVIRRALAVSGWRNLRGLGAHYLQQSVCLLQATPKTTRATARLVTRLRAEGGQGEMLRVELTESGQETTVTDAMQRGEPPSTARSSSAPDSSNEELRLERRRGRTTYTELEESDADSRAIRNGSPPSVSATTSMPPAVRRPPRPSPRARRPSPGSRAEPSPPSPSAAVVTGLAGRALTTGVRPSASRPLDDRQSRYDVTRAPGSAPRPVLGPENAAVGPKACSGALGIEDGSAPPGVACRSRRDRPSDPRGYVWLTNRSSFVIRRPR
jgi:hypothetical protein